MPDTVTVKMVVNGAPAEVTAEESAPLLYILRNELGLAGTRFGCGTGFCGACMVIVDGKAVQSCDLPLAAADGVSVETIEGLSSGEARHPILDAVVEHQAAQCGYCLPGIAMSAKALLDANPSPSRAEILEALDDNLCRCGAHLRIVRAIEDAARRMQEARA